MTTFNPLNHFSRLAIALACLTHPLHADVIDLTHGDLLTGKITSLDQEMVTLTSPLTSQPLNIKSSNIQKISFDVEKSHKENHSELVTLVNGDSLPCDVVALDEQSLQISTWYAGDFTIPRTKISTLQFGIATDQVFYRGTDEPSTWSSRSGSWTLSDKGYTCQGSGRLARKIEHPQNLRIRFTLAWENTPNISFRFCADNDKASTKQNAYEFSFGSAGLRLRRVLNKATPAALFTINLKPHEIDNQKLDVDLRINRELGEVTLFLDGKQRGSWIDTFPTTEGSYIILSNGSNIGQGCHIGNLIVSQWIDGTGVRNRKKINQEKEDILIDDEDERLSGRFLAIERNPKDERVIKLKTPYSKKPLLIPTRRLDTLVFAEAPDLEKPATSHYSAQIQGGGNVKISKPKLTGEIITSTHPILGPFRINTSAISSIHITP